MDEGESMLALCTKRLQTDCTGTEEGCGLLKDPCPDFISFGVVAVQQVGEKESRVVAVSTLDTGELPTDEPMIRVWSKESAEFHVYASADKSYFKTEEHIELAYTTYMYSS